MSHFKHRITYTLYKLMSVLHEDALFHYFSTKKVL
jgi:hypothetical protein